MAGDASIFPSKVLLLEGLQTTRLDGFWSCVLWTFPGDGEGQPSLLTLKGMVELAGPLWTGATVRPVSHL